MRKMQHITFPPDCKAVLFDLDDTLINSDAYSKAYRTEVLMFLHQKQLISQYQMGLINKMYPVEQKHCIHGYSLREHLPTLCQAQNISLKNPKKAATVYHERLLTLLSTIELTPLPVACRYAKACLTRLNERNIPFGIVSNSPRYFIDKLLRGADMQGFNFYAIVGEAGDKSEHIINISKRLGLQTNQIAFVGDSFSDSAFACHVDAFAVNVNTGVDDWSCSQSSYIEDLKPFHAALQRLNKSVKCND